MTAAIEGGEWSAARPGRTLPSGQRPYPFYRRLNGLQGRYGRAEKSRPHWDSIPDRPARSSVAIATELPGPQTWNIGNEKLFWCCYRDQQSQRPYCSKISRTD